MNAQASADYRELIDMGNTIWESFIVGSMKKFPDAHFPNILLFLMKGTEGASKEATDQRKAALDHPSMQKDWVESLYRRHGCLVTMADELDLRTNITRSTILPGALAILGIESEKDLSPQQRQAVDNTMLRASQAMPLSVLQQFIAQSAKKNECYAVAAIRSGPAIKIEKPKTKEGAPPVPEKVIYAAVQNAQQHDTIEAIALSIGNDVGMNAQRVGNVLRDEKGLFQGIGVAVDIKQVHCDCKDCKAARVKNREEGLTDEDMEKNWMTHHDNAVEPVVPPWSGAGDNQTLV